MDSPLPCPGQSVSAGMNCNPCPREATGAQGPFPGCPSRPPPAQTPLVTAPLDPCLFPTSTFLYRNLLFLWVPVCVRFPPSAPCCVASRCHWSSGGHSESDGGFRAAGIRLLIVLSITRYLGLIPPEYDVT